MPFLHRRFSKKQVKALDSLPDALAAKPAPTAKVSPFYRAAWMDLLMPDQEM